MIYDLQDPPNLPKKPPGTPPENENEDLGGGKTSPPNTPPKTGTKVQKLTDFFNKLGDHPSKKKTPVKPKLHYKNNSPKVGNIVKKKGKSKLDDPKRAKMETALRKFSFEKVLNNHQRGNKQEW